jgi:hypothetical protein|tara:strand:+ start:964 stop:1425 length:462 start_codon:yes stop_codon:yes gene_type:complete
MENELESIKQQAEVIKAKVELEEQRYKLAEIRASNQRARSVTIGACTGGLVELCMRGDFESLYYIMHPVEAVELINSIAAQVGLDVATRPKEDYSTWRMWDPESIPDQQWLGAAPYQISDEAREELLKNKNLKIKGVTVKEEEKPLLPHDETK